MEVAVAGPEAVAGGEGPAPMEIEPAAEAGPPEAQAGGAGARVAQAEGPETERAGLAGLAEGGRGRSDAQIAETTSRGGGTGEW